MGMSYNGRDYWCSLPAEKLNLSIFAFVSKEPNWFPLNDMAHCMEAYWSSVSAGAHKYVVLIGLSQGGYAALKYSRMLGPDTAISFSPQWSIDPRDIEDGRFNHFYRSEINRDMKIVQRDIYGRSFVFYDPQDGNDARHVSLIGGSDSMTLFPLPYSGHASIKVFVGTNNIYDLIQACLKGDYASIRRLYSKLKRANHDRPALIAHKLPLRRAGIILDIFNKYGRNYDSDLWIHPCYILGEAGFGHQVIEWLETYTSKHPHDLRAVECLCLVACRIKDKALATKAADILIDSQPDNERIRYIYKLAQDL
jgi:hypothetical protein